MAKPDAKGVTDTAPTSRALSFIDIFAGCGGLSLGLMQAGWKGLFAIERDENAFKTLYHNLIAPNARYRFQWPDWLPKSAIGISEVLDEKAQNLAALAGQIDMVVGGPPCQGFSNAGRRKSSDPRNKLVEAYLEFVHLLKPRVVLIENVRGITSDFKNHSLPNGRTNYARWIIDTLSDKYSVSSQMIDTSEFGVPQKRFRFFVIAFRKDTFNSHLQPFDQINNGRLNYLRRKGITTIPVSAKMAISDLELRYNKLIDSRDTIGFQDIGYNGPHTSYQTAMNQGHEGLLHDTRLARHKPEIQARFSKIIDICHADGRLNISLSSELRASFGIKKRAIRVLDPDSPSPTITSMPDDLIHYSEPRTLTVRENARLQSFPDWFAFKGNYTTGGNRRRKEVPRFTQVANAVPPLVAEAFGEALKSMIGKSTQFAPHYPLSGANHQIALDTQEEQLAASSYPH